MTYYWRIEETYLNDILLLSNLAGTAAKAFFVGPEIDPLDDVLTGIGEVG